MITLVLINAMNFIDGLDGLAGRRRRDLRDRAVHLLRADPRAVRQRHLGVPGPVDVGGAGGLVPRASCRTTSSRRGSSWATPARCSSGWPCRRRSPRSAAPSTPAGWACAPPSRCCPRCWSPWPSCSSRCSTSCSPSSAGPERAGIRSAPTSGTCTTGCWRVGHHHRQAVLVFYLWALVLSAIAVALGFTAWQNVVWPALVGVLVATDRRHLAVDPRPGGLRRAVGSARRPPRRWPRSGRSRTPRAARLADHPALTGRPRRGADRRRRAPSSPTGAGRGAAVSETPRRTTRRPAADDLPLAAVRRARATQPGRWPLEP